MLKHALPLFLFFFFSAVSGQINTRLDADRAILINADTGAILFEKKAYEKAYPASITKLATLLYVLSLDPDLDQEITVGNEPLRRMSKSKKKEQGYKVKPYLIEPDGMHFSIRRGEKLKLYDLLCGMMINSSNDAANVVAYHFGGGSIEKFVEGMNDYLKELGCISTRFFNPNGFHFPGHTTTAYDVALMGKHALKNPLVMKLTSMPKYTRPKTNKQKPVEYYQYNRLLRQGKFRYEKAMGIKTGYIEDAKHTFVTAARDESRTLVAVVLGCSSSEARYRDVIKLFDAAFAEKPVTRHFFNKNDALFSATVNGAKTRLDAYLTKDIVLNYFPSEKKEVEVNISWDELVLPINKNQKVGYVMLREAHSGAHIHAEPLYAKNRVGASLGLKLKRVFTNPLKFSFSRWFWLSVLVLSRLYYRSRRRLKVSAKRSKLF